MADEYEQSRKKLEELIDWYSVRKADRNEATTRLHLIDTLFLQCLGWTKDDVRAEESQDGEYTDYSFMAPRRMLIVEAKREGDYFELPVGTKRLERPIPALCRDYPNVKKALEQVAGYCQKRGVQFGAVCNGHQIITFIACRNDGVAPLDGRALVFSNLEEMKDNFLQFWEALSKPAVQDKKLLTRLVGDTGPRIPPKLAAEITNYPGLKGRNVFQTDLQILSEFVMEDVARSPELEERFLRECYCKSGALSQHSLVAKQILEARYAGLFDNDIGGPAVTPATKRDGISPELFAESLSRRPIILLGDIGVGKTTFIRNLIRIEAARIFENAVALHIDLGSRGILAMDLRQFILDEIARQLRERYQIDIEERNFVRSVYNLEIQRFKRSVYGDLMAANKMTYKHREISFLEEKLQKREEHIKYSFQNIAKGQKKQIVFFIDNADQRTEDIQEQAFLISQEIAQTWPVTVFVALRPTTFHRSLRSGLLSGYHPKAFTISPPRIDTVLDSRLKFSIKIASGEMPLSSLGSGVGVQLHALEKIMRSFQESLKQPNALIEFIDNIAGGNVRLALDLVRQFFGSGYVDTEKIVDVYDKSGRYYVALHEFLRAVIYGDAAYYEPSQSYIANIFDIGWPDPKEHFLTPVLISFLQNEGLKSGHEGFVEVGRIYERLQAFGFTADQIDHALVRSMRKKLIEAGWGRLPDVTEPMPQALRATSVGVYHIRRLIQFFSYVDAMVVDTPILEQPTREQIGDVHQINERLSRAEIFRQYLDKQWKEFESVVPEFDWRAVSKDLKEDIESILTRLSSRKVDTQDSF